MIIILRFTCDLEKWLTLQDWELKLVVDAQEYCSHLLLSEGSCLVQNQNVVNFQILPTKLHIFP